MAEGNNIADGLRIYCGNRSPLPLNYDSFGSRLYCFRRGFNVGKYVQSTKTKKEIVERIQNEGIGFLKDDLKLSGLNKDLIRSIALRLTGTPQAVPRYSSLTREQLIDELVIRGFQR